MGYKARTLSRNYASESLKLMNSYAKLHFDVTAGVVGFQEIVERVNERLLGNDCSATQPQRLRRLGGD